MNLFSTLVISARDTLRSHLSQATSLSDLRDIVITPDVIRDSIAHLKRGKSVGLSSDHVINASIPLEQFLAPIFTACFRHGHVPAAFRDAIVQPILKGADKDPSLSSNYRGIVLASPFSKLIDGMVHNSDVRRVSYQL